jgi:hypothetical protein
VAIGRYVLTATVTAGPGAPAAPVAGEPGTRGPAGYGSSSTPLSPATYQRGQAIVLDPAGPLYAAIGAGNLQAYVQGRDDVGHAALGN